MRSVAGIADLLLGRRGRPPLTLEHHTARSLFSLWPDTQVLRKKNCAHLHGAGADTLCVSPEASGFVFVWKENARELRCNLIMQFHFGNSIVDNKAL